MEYALAREGLIKLLSKFIYFMYFFINHLYM